jgi:hypothetical protein
MCERGNFAEYEEVMMNRVRIAGHPYNNPDLLLALGEVAVITIAELWHGVERATGGPES